MNPETTHEQQRRAYEERERADLTRQIDELARAPLAERKHARDEWRDAMANHRPTISERIEWLFQGSYGWGAMDRARSIAANNRMNQTAGIGQLLAAVEWQCAPDEARKAWHDLNAEQRALVADVIRQAIEEATKEEQL